MSNKNNLLEDLAKLTGNAAGVVVESSKSLQEKVRGMVSKSLSNMDIVKREEFDVVKAMAEKARLENEELKKRLDKIEGKKAPAKATKKKPATKKKATVKKSPAKKAATKKKATKKSTKTTKKTK